MIKLTMITFKVIRHLKFFLMYYRFYNGTASKSDAIETGNDKMRCGVLPVEWNETNWAVSCTFRESQYRDNLDIDTVSAA
jgi:hypothetical protein